MRAGRAVLIGVAAVLAVLVVGLWVLPSLLDWNRYRDSIAAFATSSIGRPVRIDGPVTLHLLPQPILTASGIAVDDIGDGALLTARELRLRVALGPLLAGNIDARDLTLRGADLRLPWPLAPGALGQRPPTWLTGLQARVEGSRIQIGRLAVTGIDAGLTTDPDTGTLATTGTGQVGARPWRFTARLARAGRDGTAGLEISLDGQGPLRDTGGTFSGQLAGDGALSGRIAGRGPDLSQLLPAPAVAWRGEGRMSAAAGLAVADELALEIGGSPARGAIALRVLPQARLDLALAAGRLDLDAWLPVLMRGAETAMPTGIDLSAEAATFAGGTLRRLRGAFDLDPDGVTVQDLTALLPGDAQLTLSGRLLGRPRAEGVVPRPPPASPVPPAQFEGMGHLAAPDLRATLRWLEPWAPVGFGGIAPAVLRSADLSAKISVGTGQASLSDLRGLLDGNPLTGGLGLKLGPRLSIGAGLSFERLTLDPWLPDLSLLATPAGMTDALARAAGVDVDVNLQVRAATWRGQPMGQIALDAQTEATRLTLRRLEANPLGMLLTASGTIGEGGRVTEGRVELTATDLAPLRALLPPELPLLVQMPTLLPQLLRGPGTALLQLSGTPEALAARLTLEASDLRFDAQPTLNLTARRWAGPVTLRHPGAPRLLEQAGYGGAAAWLGDGSLSLLAQVSAAKGRIVLDNFDVVAGSLRAKGQMAIELSAENEAAAGNGAVPANGVLPANAAATPRIAGVIVAETLPLPLPYLRSPNPFPVAGLLGWQAALHLEAAEVLFGQTPVMQAMSAELLLRDGTLNLSRASGRLNGGTVSGSANLAAGNEPPRLTVQADLDDMTLDGPALETAVDLTAGVVDAKLDLTAAGYSPAALLATLAGTATVSVQNGTIDGLDIQATAEALSDPDAARVVTRVSQGLTRGITPFTRLDFPLHARRGVMSGEGILATTAGDARISGSVDLLGGAADLRIAVHPGLPVGAPPDAPEAQPRPELGLRVIGPAAALVRTPELAGLSLWLAERP